MASVIKFPPELCEKNQTKKIKPFSGTFEFTWKATTSIMSITNFFKTLKTFEKLEQWPQTWKSYKNGNSLWLKPLPNFRLIGNQFNNSTQEDNNIDPEKDNVVHCKYFGTEQLQSMKMINKNQIIFLISKKNAPLMKDLMTSNIF